MKCYLTISVDVEPDCSSNWQYSSPLQFEGVKKGIGERLQPLFDEYGQVPTYLINNVVLENDATIDFFKKMQGKFELGTHLHPEFIAPQKEFFDYAGKSGRANCCFYSPEIEREKIRNISSLFRTKFGFDPTSFRAGRFSAGANTIAALAELGYKVDTSVTPHISWNDRTREQPVDFTKAPEQPYFIRSGSISEPDVAGRILQVPVTIGLFKRHQVKEFVSSAGGLRRNMRSHKPVWLRPYYTSASRMKVLAEQFITKYATNEIIVLNMMFHNVEVLPGISPYTNSEKDCNRYLSQLKIFFSFCKARGIEGIGLSELYDVYRK
ncbi:MAG: hypothetical protein ACJ749_19170 [Flavisolibacter sp.]